MASNASTLLPILLEWYRQMRESELVSYDARLGIWHVLRYDDTLHILTNPVTSQHQAADSHVCRAF